MRPKPRTELTKMVLDNNMPNACDHVDSQDEEKTLKKTCYVC